MDESLAIEMIEGTSIEHVRVFYWTCESLSKQRNKKKIKHSYEDSKSIVTNDWISFKFRLVAITT